MLLTLARRESLQTSLFAAGIGSVWAAPPPSTDKGATESRIHVLHGRQ